jgi:hypothetical protein
MSFLSRSYPYPFLGREGDFENSSFDFEVEPQLTNDELILHYESNILATPLAEYVVSGEIKLGLDIHSPDSYHRSFEVLGPGKNSISLPISNLGGEVRLSPICVSASEINNYSLLGLNKEFKGGKFRILAGDVLGAGPTTTFFLELDKETPKSIVRVEQDSTMEPFEYRFELRSNQIAILMGVKARAVWEAYYNNRETNPFLVLSILKDCLMFAMQDIATSDDRDNMYWSKHFVAVLEQMGIELTIDTSLEKINKVAQALLVDKGFKILFERATN